jgi:hypothetical protein
MLRHTNLILPMIAAAVASFFAGKKDPLTIPLINTNEPKLTLGSHSIAAGSYGSLDYGSIAQARRNNRRGKIVRRYR